MASDSKIAAAEKAAERQIELERIRNEKRLEKLKLKMEADRKERIANETPEQRQARLAEEDREEKREQEKHKRWAEESRQSRLSSKNIDYAIGDSLTEFANDRKKFGNVNEIINYLDEMVFIIEKFVGSKDDLRKYKLIERMNMALLRYQSVLKMFTVIEPMNPMYDEYEDNYNRYRDHLQKVEKGADKDKTFMLVMRILVVALLVLAFVVGDIFPMISTVGWCATFWWCVYEYRRRKRTKNGMFED